MAINNLESNWGPKRRAGNLIKKEETQKRKREAEGSDASDQEEGNSGNEDEK